MNEKQRARKAQKVTWVGFFFNFLLTAFKILAGIFGRSTAMIADGIHSLSDFVTDLIVILFLNVSGKARDEDHRYGHGKYETFATLLISIALLLVALGILWTGVSKIMQVINGAIIQQPTYIALAAALLSLLVKELLFWYTKRVGDKINSSALIANAWHHRSDAFSSIATALGITGAMFLGEQWRILDPIAGVVVSFFILKVAIQLGMPSVHELLERSLPPEIEKEIDAIVMSHHEIITYHNLKTRKVGTLYAIDIHIKLDSTITFVKSHDIATELERELRKRFGEMTITNIHTEPLAT